MKLITQFEAAVYDTAELCGLHHQAYITYSAAPRGSQEQRDALAVMQVIERALAARPPAP